MEILNGNIIDDFEDGDGSIVVQQGRSGYWFTYNDGNGTQTPSGDFLPQSGGPSGSSFCGHTAGSGFTEWGATLAVEISGAAVNCSTGGAGYDASVFDGIAFDAVGNVPIMVGISIAATTTVENGGICTADCENTHFHVVYPQSRAAWRQYQVRFDELIQGSWGTPVAFDPSQIMAIQFSTAAGLEFDFSVDNVAFFGPDGVTNESLYGDNTGPSTRTVRAGARASTYGVDPFPSAAEWGTIADTMAGYVNGSRPAVIWIVCNAWTTGCGRTSDNDTYLDYFDTNGIDVILQVEPGTESVPALIDEMLTAYSSHPCVIGFGVDVEFLGADHDLGVAVDDETAQAWLEQVRSYDPDYILMLKHFNPYLMPPCTKDGMLFVDDTQDHTEAEIMSDYAAWASMLAPADVGFQIGYPADESWWSTYDNPPRDLAQQLVADHANTAAVFWVDFTLDSVFTW